MSDQTQTEMNCQPSELTHKAYPLPFVPHTFDDLTILGYLNLLQIFRAHRKDEGTLRKRLKAVKGMVPENHPDRIKLAEVRSKHTQLRLLMDNATTAAPMFASFRPVDHYREDDEVICYIGRLSPSLKKTTNFDWAAGKVVAITSYGTHFAACKVRFFHPVHEGTQRYSVREVAFAMNDPKLLKAVELQYLCQNKQYSSLWWLNTVPSMEVPFLMATQMQTSGEKLKVLGAEELSPLAGYWLQ